MTQYLVTIAWNQILLPILVLFELVLEIFELVLENIGVGLRN